MTKARWCKLVLFLGSLAIGFCLGASSPPRSSRYRIAAIGYTWTSLKLEYESERTAATEQAVERFLAAAKKNSTEIPSVQALQIVATVAGATASESSHNTPKAEVMWREATTLCRQAHWERCSKAELGLISATAMRGGRK